MAFDEFGRYQLPPSFDRPGRAPQRACRRVAFPANDGHDARIPPYPSGERRD